MRRNTKGTGFAGAVFMTVFVVGLMLLFTWATLAAYFEAAAFFSAPGNLAPALFVTGVTLVMAVLFIAIAVGAVKALIQRWREIERGELDEARKY